MQYNIIIVGAGSAGIPCAIRAAARGLKVLVIEKDTVVGGTLHITAGHLSAAGTKRQQEKGIADTIESHYADVARISRHTLDAAIAAKAVALAPGTIDWLADLGYQFHEKTPLVIYGHEAYSTPRTYFGADDYAGGPIVQPGKAVLKTLLPVFEKLVAEKRIELKTGHRLTRIMGDEKAVTGVVVKQGETEWTFFGDNIILTTGGYAANPAFFQQQHQTPLISTARTTSTGDGIIAAMETGAVFHGAEKHISTLGGVELEPGSGRADFWAAWARVSNSHDRKPREIYINQAGRRFMNEYDLSVDERERIVLQQPGKRFYVLFDEAALTAGPCVVVQWNAEQFREEARKEKCCWSAHSIATLAAKIKVPVNELLHTVTDYNHAVAIQQDTAFGRTFLENKLNTPPYYALLVHAYSLISFGGIKVNEHLQVLNRHQEPIRHLFAAGEILGAGATSGNAFCGGMLLTPAISFGKWLGETV
jgi:succinate dehydrogenase/fumarate reductase flavoprotein subunit